MDIEPEKEAASQTDNASAAGPEKEAASQTDNASAAGPEKEPASQPDNATNAGPEKEAASDSDQNNAGDSKTPAVAVASDKKKKSNKLKTVAYLLAAVLIGVLVLAGAVVGIFYHYYSLMDTDEKDYDYSHVVSLTDDEKGDVTADEVELPDEDIYSEENVFNILLIGTDERSEDFDPYARADSIMVLSLNKKTHSVKLVSLERGMNVRMPGNKHDLLTHTFHYGGAKLVMETVRTHFNLDTDRYIRVNFTVFQKLIDRIGGVDITLSAKEAAALNANPDLNVTEGKNHLDGYSALCFARLRRIDSDWKRIRRQRKVIASVKNGFKGKSVLELNQILNDCLPYVQTNLTSMECADLVLNMTKFVNGDFKEMTLPAKGTHQGLGIIDYEANSRILREFLYQ